MGSFTYFFSIFSPYKNTSCNSIGKIIKSNSILIESISPVIIKKAYIIHFYFKSTEEFIHKLKRGYRDWFGNNNVLYDKLINYLESNKITKEKIDYLEKELKINLTIYRNRIKKIN